jgi:hypothetical protein
MLMLTSRGGERYLQQPCNVYARALQLAGWQIEAARLVPPMRLQIIPKGLFQEITQLTTLDLSHNAIKALPEEIAVLKCVGNSKDCLPTVCRQLADTCSIRC